jgi:hypothetical protein
LTKEVFRAVAKAFWGSEEAADVSSYHGKAAHGGVLPALIHAIYVVKERFLEA